jgi:HSP20 family protein
MALIPASKGNQGGPVASRSEHPLRRLRRELDSLFGTQGWLAPFEEDFETLRVWDFNVTESDKEIVVRAEMPGFDESELDVRVQDNALTIKAEKEQKGEGREEYRSFYRSIALPAGVQADNAQATYRNGVLELHIPRSEQAQPKRIKVLGQQSSSEQGKGAAPANTPQQSASQSGASAGANAKK